MPTSYINIKFAESLIFMHRYKRRKKKINELQKQTHTLAATTARTETYKQHIYYMNINIYIYFTYVYTHKKERL